MSTRGWDGITATDIARMQNRQKSSAKPSKYRNVKVQTEDGTFDSKKEHQYWQELKLRERVGEISHLRRQVDYPLYAPVLASSGMNVEVCNYRADFVFRDREGVEHVQDVKGGSRGGTRTAMYALKRRWLELQSQVTIEEV